MTKGRQGCIHLHRIAVALTRWNFLFLSFVFLNSLRVSLFSRIRAFGSRALATRATSLLKYSLLQIFELNSDCSQSKAETFFEWRTLTGSEPFSLLIYLDTTKFLLLRFFSLKETICPKVCSKSRFKSAKNILPVNMRRSKTQSLEPFRPVVKRRGDEWSIKIFNCSQNFTFARFARKI